MANYGESLSEFSLSQINGSDSSYEFSSSNNEGKITLLFFIDITQGWSWLDRLLLIENAITTDPQIPNSDVDILCVVTNYYHSNGSVSESYGFDTYSGNISNNWVTLKMNNIGPSGFDDTITHILVDSNWSSPSPAASNYSDFSGSPSAYPSPEPLWWGYLIGKDFKIADKFKHFTASPNSFSHLALKNEFNIPIIFSSSNYENLQKHLVQRIKNLINAPFIIDSVPTHISRINSLSSLDLFFSKPMNDTEDPGLVPLPADHAFNESVLNSDNYSLSGGGLSTSDITGFSFENLGNADNKATITIGGTLNDSSPDISLVYTGVQDTLGQNIQTTGDKNRRDFTLDLTNPATSIDTNPGGITHTNASEVNVSIDFGEAMRPDPNDDQTWDLEVSDLVPVNCSIKSGTFSTVNNQVWTLTLESMSNGPVSLTVPANCAQDLAGNGCEDAELTFQWDNTRPDPDITITPSGSTIAQDHFNIEVDFGEVVTGFSSEDLMVVNNGTTLTVAGGNISAATTSNQQVYSIDVTGLSEGTVTVDLASNKCLDLAGNQNLAATQASFSYVVPDTTAPVLTDIVDVAGDDPTNADTVQFRLEFSEPLGAALFSTANIIFDNCTLENPPAPSWNAANTQLTITVSPNSDGAFGITVNDNSYTDAALNPGTGNTVAITSDKTAPTVSFSGASSPFTGDSLDFSVDFSEEVTAFNPAKISTATAGVTFSVTNAGTPASSYAVSASNIPVGNMTITLAAGAGSDEAGNPSEGPVSLAVERQNPPAHKQVVLCMDMSGSMNDPVTVNGITDSKIRFVKPAIEELLTIWDNWDQPNDEYGLVKYQSTATALPAGASLQPFNAASAWGQVSGMTTGGYTAMGPGLAIALNMLDYENASDNERAILLFADGQDNVIPHVVVSAGQYQIAAGGNGFPAGMTDVQVNSTDAHKIPIHTIGIGENGGWLTKMADLSLISGGVDRASLSEQIWPDVNNGLQDLINDVYGGNTPQLVHRSQNTLATSQYSQTIPFILNKDSKKLVITVNWPGNVPLTLRLKKGNREINDNVQMKLAGKFTTLTMDFPHFELYDMNQVVVKPKWWQILKRVELQKKKAQYLRLEQGYKPWGRDFQEAHGHWNQFGDWVDPQGTWSVEILRRDGKVEAPYNISIYTDEKSLKYSYKLKNRVIKAGDPIDMIFQVNDGGLPVSQLEQGQVSVTFPREFFGNIHQSYLPQLDIIQKPGDSITDNIHRLHTQLQRIPQAKARMDLRGTKELKLRSLYKETRLRKGSFISTMTDTTVPGIYQIRMDIIGQGPKTGMFQRCISSSVLVRPNISPETSVVKKTIDPKTHDMLLHIIPKDPRGNYIGPGFGDYLDTNLVKTSIIEVKDNLDGSYHVRIRRGIIKEVGMKNKEDLRIRMFHSSFLKLDLKDFD